MTQHEQDCRDFWRAAYLSAMANYNVRDPADLADQALLEYDSRFAPVEEPAPVVEDLDLLG